MPAPVRFLLHHRHYPDLVRQILVESVCAQVTGGALAAAIALNAVVAGEGFPAHQIQLTPVVGERPGLGFIQPHQRRLKANVFRHPQADGVVQRFDKLIAAVRVAGEVGLAHAGDDGFGFYLIGVDCRQG